MSLRVPSGVTIQLTSTINNIDGSPRIDVTTSSFWDTSNVGAASVSQQGLITTHNTATVNLDNIVHVTITAASGNFISAFLIEVSMSSTPPVIQSYAVWGLSGYGDPGLVTTVNGGATFFAVTASDGAQDWLAGTAVPGTTGTAIVVGVSGNSDGPAVMRTTDKGYTWETTFPRVVQGYPDQGDMRAVAANSTSVVAVGYFPSGSSFPPDSWPAVWRSTDQGSTWTKTLITSSLLFPLGPDQYNTALTNIVWLESISRYVAAGYIIDQAWTAISDDDGITWSVKLQPDQDHTAAGYYTWGGMATDGIHVILIPQRHDHAFVTTDGVTWASHSLQLQYGGYIGQNGMAYGNGIWMVTDDANAVIVSNDIGQTWNEYTIGDGLNFYPGVAFDNQHNLFIAIAYGDPMNWAVSANGQTWTQSSGVQSNQGFFNTQGAFSAPFTATITPPPPVQPRFFGYNISAVPSASVGAYVAGYLFSYAEGGGISGTAPNDVFSNISSNSVTLLTASSTDLTNATSSVGWANVITTDDYYKTTWAKTTDSLPDVTYHFQDFNIAVTTPPLINKGVSSVGSAWTVSGTNFTQYFGGVEASSLIVANISEWPSYTNVGLYNVTYVSDDKLTFTGPTTLTPGNKYVMSVFRTDPNANADPVWWAGWVIGNPLSMDIVFDGPPFTVGSATISMLTIAAPTNYRDNPSDANLEPYPFHSGANSSAVGSPAGGNPPTGWFPFTLNNTNHRYSIPYFNNPFDACGKYVLDQTSSAGNWFVDGNGSSGTAHYGASTYPRVLSKADANGGWRHFTPDTTYSSTPGLGNYSGLVTNTNSWTRISTYNYTLQSLIVDHTGTKYGKACAGGTPESNAGQPRIAHFIGHDMPDAPYTAWDRDFTTVTSVKIYNSSNAYVADLAFKQKGTSGLITWLDPAIHAGTDMHVVFTNASSSWKSQNFDIQA